MGKTRQYQVQSSVENAMIILIIIAWAVKRNY